jgi:hypothetical protein
MVAAHRGLAALFGISGVPQFSGNLFQIRLLAHRKGMRGRINLGCIGEYWAFEPGFNNAVILDVRVRKEPNEQQRQHRKTAQGKA